MFKLTNEIRDYAWGSHTHISRLLGSGTSAGPQAELWIGAHEGDPSRTPSGEPLNRVIADSPDDMLGDRVRTMFGPRLPFLVKALAAAEPLSLQVHPTSERARMGYADQEAAGIPLTAPERSYQDPFHKPELIFALTRFEGMAGFRDTAKSAEILRLLDHPWADEIAWRLESGPAFQTLRAVVTDMLSLSGHDLVCLLAELGDSAPACGGARPPGGAPSPSASQGSRQRGPREHPRVRPDLDAHEALPDRPGRAGHAAAQPRRPRGRRGDVPRRGRHPRVHVRLRGGGDGLLRQRRPRRAHPQVRRRPRAPRDHQLHADPTAAVGPQRSQRRNGASRSSGSGVPADGGNGSPHRPAGRRAPGHPHAGGLGEGSVLDRLGEPDARRVRVPRATPTGRSRSTAPVASSS